MESKQKGESIEDIAQVNEIVESPIAQCPLKAKHKRQPRGKNRKVKYEQVWDWDNLRIADGEARHGKGKNCGVVRFDKHWWKNMTRLQEQLADGTYQNAEPTIEPQKCQRKNRILAKFPYREHIKDHAFMQVVYPYIYKSYYYGSSASIKGRGIHHSVKRVKKFIALNRHKTIYWVQLDFKKCYHLIKRAGVQRCFDKMFNDKRLRDMAHGIIYALGEHNGIGQSDGTDGMGIGQYPIQPLVNFRFNALDRELARRVDFVDRYCDNILMCEIGDVAALWDAIRHVIWYADNVLHQPLHMNIGVQRLDERHPIDYVGYKFYPTHTYIRDEIKHRFKKKYNKIKDEEARRQMTASYKGWLMHADGLHLWQTITGMRSFKELDFKQNDTDENGKRYFNVPMVNASFIVGREIVVEDYEDDVVTRNGGGRMCVLITENNERKKFLTNNPRLKDIMHQSKELGYLPFKAVLRSKPIGGSKVDYYFE